MKNSKNETSIYKLLTNRDEHSAHGSFIATLKQFILMKKMMIALCIGLFAIAACSKDSGTDGPSGENVLLLSEISINDVVMQRLEYNDKNLVTKQLIYDFDNTFLGTRTHTYNQKNSLVRIVDATINTETIYEDYVYDNQNKLISGTITMGGKLLWNLTYQQTKNKLVQNSISSDGKSINTNTFTFDDKGNLLKIEHVMNGDPVGTNEWYDYDNLKGAAGSIGDAISMLFSSPNNPTKEKHAILNQIIEYDLKYTYNDSGYPTQMKRYKKGTDDLVDVTDYKYISAK